MNKKKAFTLVELLVVIAIIAILAVAGVVGYTVFTEKAKKSNAASELSQVKTLIQADDFSNAGYEISDGKVKDLATGEEITSAALVAYWSASEDTELKAIADAGRLSYTDGKIVMTSTSDAKYEAVWNLTNDAIEGRRKSA